MNEIINENKLFVVEEYEFENRLIQNISSIINKYYRDCHEKAFHTFKYEGIYNLNLTNVIINEIVNLTIFDKSLNINELNKKLKNARRIGFVFNQISNFKIKIYSNLSYINIHYHLRLGASHLYRQIFKKLTQNRVYIQTHCNDLNIPFQFACYLWYKYNNPGILI